MWCWEPSVIYSTILYEHIQPCEVVDQAGDDDLVDGGRDPVEDGHQGGVNTKLRS